MTTKDWQGVMDQAASLGVSQLSLIGGEPTSREDFPELLTHALQAGLRVEVYTNLLRIRPQWWPLLEADGVSLATSYYSDRAVQHEQVTGRRGSHARTRANIVEALRRGIPLRAGIIDLDDGQRVEAARVELDALGVTDVGVDRLRQVGRGVRDAVPSTAQLCGNCGQGVVAISPDGAVWPCVFSRWLPVENVREKSLAQIWNGPAMSATAARLAREFQAYAPQAACTPEMCNPKCGPSCGPACKPKGDCTPAGNCAPNYSCGPCHPKDRVCNPDKNCKPNQCKPTR